MTQNDPASSPMDSRALRNAFGCFATGVTVVTTMGQHGAIGTTMNSFTSVSLDPPLILFSMGRDSEHFDDFTAAKTFAVNVLSTDQEDQSNRFATPGRQPMTDGEFTTGKTGSPILPGALTTLDCTLETHYDGGDHIIFLCRVVTIAPPTDGKPLIYYRGGYAALA